MSEETKTTEPMPNVCYDEYSKYSEITEVDIPDINLAIPETSCFRLMKIINQN